MDEDDPLLLEARPLSGVARVLVARPTTAATTTATTIAGSANAVDMAGGGTEGRQVLAITGTGAARRFTMGG